ncbi:hypothetical protein HLB35_07755 [Halomonas sp. TBZ9]|uniref:Uncharacterized protein n=1 Tax=Vreelandella azerica TaxID=2732867 RepID=A0A7Y3XAV6_9GAMM|nr:hypothetical protein [Halomonas azerica]NOG31693.1 hypothetical protein [Halomonas azerica]
MLGRIMRRQGDGDATCYFYALNETRLRRFARRLTNDLPDDLAKVMPVGNTARATDAQDTAATGTKATADGDDDTSADSPVATGDIGDTVSSESNVAISFNETTTQQAVAMSADVAFSDAFFERLVALQITG